MIKNERQLQLSGFYGIYAAIVPTEHILRKIKTNVDFSFVNSIMKDSYCAVLGRPAYEPELMLKILFLKMYYDLSDREVMSRCATDMAFKYFLDINPEDGVPDASLLAKFRTLRIKEKQLEQFLQETVRQAINKGVIKSNAIIVDATHTRSKHTPQIPTQMLREMTKNLRKEIYRTQSELKEKFPEKPSADDDIFAEIAYTKGLADVLASVELKSEKAGKLLKKVKKTLELPNLAELQNPTDEDAKIGHKSEDGDFFGYKNHIAMSEEGVITGLSVTDGTVADTNEFEKIVTQTIDSGLSFEYVTGDKAYSAAKNLEFAQSRGLKVAAKLKDNVCVKEYSDDYVSFNKDADTYECKNSCLAVVRKNGKGKNGAQRFTYSFNANDCAKCPHFKECVKKGKQKRIQQTSKLAIHERQREFQETDEFKEKYKERYRIEQKNADLKNNHGLKKTYGTGLVSMRAQSFLTAISSNLTKIAKLAAA